MLLFNDKIWCQRWQALQSTIQHHLRRAENDPSPIERQATLQSLLTSLYHFGKSQVDFFIAGFGPDAKVRLEPSTAYPPAYALRATLDQIAYDLDLIQRAQQQRTKGSSSRPMRETLARADLLAYRALAPAICQGLIDNTTVVTYYQKVVNVRIIPYAPVAFIGLPLSAMTTPRDLLAIPHEVGHYVFRHGRVQTGPFRGSRFDAALASQLADFPAWARNWLEEIFADVYGALVAGPIMALGFEELVTDDRVADFIHDDGEHPVAALRLAIYHRVFRNLGCYAAEVEGLQARWHTVVDQLGAPIAFTPAGQAEAINLAEAQIVVEEMVDLIMAGDLAQLQADRTLWSPALQHPSAVADLFQHFDEAVGQLAATVATQVPEIELYAGVQGEPWLRLAPLPAQSGLAMLERKAGATGLWIDAIKESKGCFNMPPAVWMALLDGSGWAIEGPGANAH